MTWCAPTRRVRRFAIESSIRECTTSRRSGQKSSGFCRTEALRLVATVARAFHNDVEVWVNEDATALIGSTTCDQQRDFAASLWAEWRDLGDVPASGAGVTIKSYTGRTLASAEQGFSGAQFHCD